MNALLLKRLVLDPVLAEMGGKFNAPEAKKLLGAIAQQESDLLHREQYPTGPAVSWWQFERIGVADVVQNRVTKPFMRDWCINLGVPFSTDAIYGAMVQNDLLACVVARLNLYNDPEPLPNNEADGWRYYIRNWAPGKPRPADWHDNWVMAP